MIREHSLELRVRYAETDQMKYVYYGHYAQYFEMGRTDLIRSLGITYREMEEVWGVMLPVRELQVQYKRPAKYDDLLRVVSRVEAIPQASIRIFHEVYRKEQQAEVLLVSGQVELVFVDKNTMRPIRAPQQFIDALNSTQ